MTTHLVEHEERRVREDRFHLTGKNDQSRQSPRLSNRERCCGLRIAVSLAIAL